ncbi:glycosyltransferase domain-containing protein [Pseudotamlana agarivorans]|uniref:glycosyltransferase domain-containing protein n=1 Tax=Pseudotamlana agarivorans TaxID=481183 RepID=UPI0008323AAE|nr:glycosyltransferase domain-containing protein [Tamlana agarivorans]
MVEKSRIVVYTAIFGSYSGLIAQPKIENVDYICYTDQNLVAKNWEIIKVKPPIENDNTRSNRYYKILPHKHLSNEYDISIYIDSNIWILQDINTLVREKLENAKMACFDHNQTTRDRRNCIYEEYLGILDFATRNDYQKDDPAVMKQQMDRFKKEGYPENNGLITAPILIRKHFDPEIINLMEAWWHIVLNESKRDQLSFNYVAWKHNFTSFSLIDGDVREGNPWFYTIRHRDSYAFKIFKLKLKRFLRIE